MENDDHLMTENISKIIHKDIQMVKVTPKILKKLCDVIFGRPLIFAFCLNPGIVGGVEETLALNALVVYWNPLESPAKVCDYVIK
jgi:hypothetical protein